MDALSEKPDAVLSCTGLDVAIGEWRLVNGLDMTLRAGQLVCVIGCNGAGKTTLLHTLAGLHGDRRGIALGRAPLTGLSRRAVARQLAVLLQRHHDEFPVTVIDAVISGRHPHSGFLDFESETDYAIAAQALADLDLRGLERRETGTLSGGERQRVAVAAVLAQQPTVYLLDEPLNNLDPRHQLAVMQRLRAECERGAGVIAVMHDLNLVAHFADRVLMLYGPQRDGAWQSGAVDDCMTAEALSRLYAVTVSRHTIDGREVFLSG